MIETIRLDGKRLAAELRLCLKHKIHELTHTQGIAPCLAVVLVGDDPASSIYVSGKEKAALEVGLRSQIYRLPANTAQGELNERLKALNEDPGVHGILLQLPLPAHLDEQTALLQINPLKDVDGLHPFNLGMLMTGQPNLAPCTPSGAMSLLASYEIALAGKRAVVIGRSRLVGRPMAQLLTNAHATVTLAHSRTPEPELIELIAASDIVVAALGKPDYIQGAWLKPSAVVVDVGINRLPNGSLVGDVHQESCMGVAAAITPVPGGIGPLTIAYLLLNTVRAFEIQCLGFSSTEA